jgi:hypothetical protein
MDRSLLVGGVGLFVGLSLHSAASEIRDLDARCFVRTEGNDFGPPGHCDAPGFPHNRTIFSVNVGSSISSVSISNGAVVLADAEHAAERPDRRFPLVTFPERRRT